MIGSKYCDVARSNRATLVLPPPLGHDPVHQLLDQAPDLLRVQPLRAQTRAPPQANQEINREQSLRDTLDSLKGMLWLIIGKIQKVTRNLSSFVGTQY
jgi:hypothetical protein